MKRADITNIFPDATDEQIDKLMSINGSDINDLKKGADELRKQLETANKSLDAANKVSADAEKYKDAAEKAAALEAEINEIKRTNALRELRELVAKEKGVPAELLTAETEEDCKAQADGILAFAKPSAYPTLKDAGEVSRVSTASTRDKFAAWANENLK